MADKYSSFGGIAFGINSSGVFSIGEFSSTGDNFFAIDASTRTKALDVCVDDGGTALTAGSMRAARSRFLVRTAIADSPDLSVFGHQGHVKVGAVSVTNSARFAGLWGYFESVSGSTLGGNYAGVYAMADLPTGATLSSGAVLSGLQIGSNDLGGTSTGDMSCIHVPNPVTGTWDYLFQVGTTPGFSSASDTAVTANLRWAVKIGDSVHYIPLMAGT